MMGLVPIVVGFSSYILGKGFVGLFLFGLMALVVSPFLSAMLVASKWQQWRYLGKADLAIVG